MAGAALRAVVHRLACPISASRGSAGRGESRPKRPASRSRKADRLFTAGRYDEAGRCYAALARENRLPAHRNVHWAYCRMVEVARRINLRPRTTREWDEIASEIGNIQRLTPNIWYGEYLRNKVAEVRRSGRRPLAKSDNLVVRGSEPDESQKQPEQPSRGAFPGSSASRAPARAHRPSPQAAAAAPSASGERPLNLPGDSSQPATALAARRRPRDDRHAGRKWARGSIAAAHGRRRQSAPAMTGPAWRGRSTKPPISASSTRMLAWRRRPAMPPRPSGRRRRSAGPVRPLQRPGRPACDLYLYPVGQSLRPGNQSTRELAGLLDDDCATAIASSPAA